MTNQDDRNQEQVEEHSLPGTNQAGKGPDASDEKDQGGGRALPDQLEEHSLPGTNQAGKEIPPTD